VRDTSVRSADTAADGAENPDLALARGGDDSAFTRLLEPLRRELHAHCYRMLGSPHDADDALQDALLRAWRGLARFEGRSSLRSWLYTVATRTCLDTVEHRGKRALPIGLGPSSDSAVLGGAPLSDVAWLAPYPDSGLAHGPAGPDARYEQREAVEIAFVAALQHLPGNQRAALLLFEVLGFSAAERVPLTGCGSWRHLPTSANGQSAVGAYLWDDDAGAHVGWSIYVLTLRGEHITEITSFIGPEHIARFDLPASLP
jgi:RNA polymerase sigma-70 factor (ECF subfamily)